MDKHEQLAELLVEQCDGATPERCREVIVAFVKLLDEQNLLGSWRRIERGIHKAWKSRYGASNVEVASAYEISDKLKKNIEAISPGADRTYTIDERLIGGIKLRIDDILIDGTIAGQLKRLKASL